MKRLFTLMLLTSPLNIMCYLESASHLKGVDSWKEVTLKAELCDPEGDVFNRPAHFAWDSRYVYKNNGILLAQKSELKNSFMTNSGYQATIHLKGLDVTSENPTVEISTRLDYIPFAAIYISSYLGNPQKVLAEASSVMADKEEIVRQFDMEGRRIGTLKVWAYITTYNKDDDDE